MVKQLKKYNLLGEQVGEVSLEDSFLGVSANSQMVKDYLVAIRNNARQWSANTKTRSEVCRTGKKPHQQKGLGRARQGSTASPQYKGGGRVFGPRPKFDQHVRINRKERRACMAALFADQIKEDGVVLLQQKQDDFVKTKQIAEFLKKIGLQKKVVLFLGSSKESKGSFVLGMRNIPKVFYLSSATLNGYSLARSSKIVILEGAFEELVDKFFKKGCVA